MDRASIYFLNEKDSNTFDFDEQLPPLPLPELRDTLFLYYESLLPFGNEDELANSRAVIAKFENGIGKQLHAKLKERAGKMKNWLDEWWDAYGYHTLRLPLNPYIVMAMAGDYSVIGIEESSENLLKNLSRIIHHTLEFWNLLRQGKIKPLSSNGGKIKYSSNLYKRFFSTTRVPGVNIDHIEKHFRTTSEGKTPSHCLISGKGRIFVFDTLHENGSLITVLEIYILLQRIRSLLDYEPMGDCVPVLTHDNRTSWAHNHQHLREISHKNVETLKLIESSSISVAFDENEPKYYDEVSALSIGGDYHSKWGDRSSTIVAYKNGKFAYIGEHSSYDGTVSVSYGLFVLLSLAEVPAPNWENTKNAKALQFRELKFELDEKINQEIKRVLVECDERAALKLINVGSRMYKRGITIRDVISREQGVRINVRSDVIVTYEKFEDYGKSYIKTCKLHPDSFIQVIMQLAYFIQHGSIAPTYETALMRHYYNGRTETLRSCTKEVHKFLKIAVNPHSKKIEIVNAFKTAVEHHSHMMNEARKGHGIDRHLFGLWCVANENGVETPEFFNDPLYSKSGGNGNYILSTSTLGYSSILGFCAPMLLDGYGCFYSITDNTLFIQITAYRNSFKTSAHKFNTIFMETLRKMKALIEDVRNSKL